MRQFKINILKLGIQIGFWRNETVVKIAVCTYIVFFSQMTWACLINTLLSYVMQEFGAVDLLDISEWLCFFFVPRIYKNFTRVVSTFSCCMSHSNVSNCVAPNKVVKCIFDVRLHIYNAKMHYYTSRKFL